MINGFRDYPLVVEDQLAAGPNPLAHAEPEPKRLAALIWSTLSIRVSPLKLQSASADTKDRG